MTCLYKKLFCNLVYSFYSCILCIHSKPHSFIGLLKGLKLWRDKLTLRFGLIKWCFSLHDFQLAVGFWPIGTLGIQVGRCCRRGKLCYKPESITENAQAVVGWYPSFHGLKFPNTSPTWKTSFGYFFSGNLLLHLWGPHYVPGILYNFG